MNLSDKPMAFEFFKKNFMINCAEWFLEVNIIPVNRPSSKPFRILSVSNERRRLVEWLVLNPYW